MSTAIGGRASWLKRWVSVGLALWGLALSGCGAAPGGAPSLPAIEGELTLRYNRLPCVFETREFDFEALTPTGWERVAVTDPPSGETLVALLREGLTGAMGERRLVRAHTTGGVRSYGVQHRARVLEIEAVLGVPPVSPTPPEAP